jgi:hypothetical protein
MRPATIRSPKRLEMKLVCRLMRLVSRNTYFGLTVIGVSSSGCSSCCAHSALAHNDKRYSRRFSRFFLWAGEQDEEVRADLVDLILLEA